MTELSPKAKALVNAYENAIGYHAGFAALLRYLINKCNEPRGTGRVDRKHHVVSVKTLMELAEELKQV